jgi:hypothetical protein
METEKTLQVKVELSMDSLFEGSIVSPFRRSLSGEMVLGILAGT